MTDQSPAYRSCPAALTVLRHLFNEKANQSDLELLEAHGYVLLKRASVRETDARIAHALALIDGNKPEGDCTVGCLHCRMREALDPPQNTASQPPEEGSR